MAIKVISNSLLQLMIRRSFLKPLVEIMSQIFVQTTSYKKGEKSQLSEKGINISNSGKC